MPMLSNYVLSRLDEHHPDTAEHSRRVADLILELFPFLDPIYWHAAACHDAGKLYFGEDILSNPNRPTDRQWLLIRKHPKLGAGLLEHEFGSVPHLTEVVARFHHERWDGKGYPYGLKGTGIPWIARLVCIADSFDAMTSDRPYHIPKDHEAALDVVQACAGTQFDPRIAGWFIKELRGKPRPAHRQATYNPTFLYVAS